jgi:hypothetical protein
VRWIAVLLSSGALAWSSLGCRRPPSDAIDGMMVADVDAPPHGLCELQWAGDLWVNWYGDPGTEHPPCQMDVPFGRFVATSVFTVKRPESAVGAHYTTNVYGLLSDELGEKCAGRLEFLMPRHRVVWPMDVEFEIRARLTVTNPETGVLLSWAFYSMDGDLVIGASSGARPGGFDSDVFDGLELRDLAEVCDGREGNVVLDISLSQGGLDCRGRHASLNDCVFWSRPYRFWLHQAYWNKVYSFINISFFLYEPSFVEEMEAL